MTNDLRRPPFRPHPHWPPQRAAGFTLVELLVVIVIIMLVSAVVLPAVIPALSNRQVGEAARILQAALVGARDAAIRANAPRGIRLMPDPTLSGAVNFQNSIFAASRIIQIEPAPDLSDGMVTFPRLIGQTAAYWANGNPPAYHFPINSATLAPLYPSAQFYPFTLPPPMNTNGFPLEQPVLLVTQALFQNNVSPLYNAPTNWFWNVRIGDKLRFSESGRSYTIVGPMTVINPELFVNDGPPSVSPYGSTHSSLVESYNTLSGSTIQANPEYLFLVNGMDDNSDGFVDTGFDGVDNDLNGYIDDTNEWYNFPLVANPPPLHANPELEKFLGAQFGQFRSFGHPVVSYTISRRPVPVAGAREVTLPGGAVIDLTTWNTTQERSRLPVDPLNGYVDILVNQSGQVIPLTEYSSLSSSPMSNAFFHFWIADRTDVYPPPSNWGQTSTTIAFPGLPMPPSDQHPQYYPGESLTGPVQTTFLKKDRQLVTLFTRTGQIVSNSINNFNYFDVNAPYYQAQTGIREVK